MTYIEALFIVFMVAMVAFSAGVFLYAAFTYLTVKPLIGVLVAGAILGLAKVIHYDANKKQNEK